jgi:hypothetical protein
MKGSHRRGKKASRMVLKRRCLNRKIVEHAIKYKLWVEYHKELARRQAMRIAQTHITCRLGAYQMAMLAAQPVPRFKDGTINRAMHGKSPLDNPKVIKALKMVQIATDTAKIISNIWSSQPTR